MQTTKFAFNSTDLPLRQHEVGLLSLFSTWRPQKGPLFAKRAGLEFHHKKAPPPGPENSNGRGLLVIHRFADVWRLKRRRMARSLVGCGSRLLDRLKSVPRTFVRRILFLEICRLPHLRNCHGLTYGKPGILCIFVLSYDNCQHYQKVQLWT